MIHPNAVRNLEDVIRRLEADGTHQEETKTLIDVRKELEAHMRIEREQMSFFEAEVDDANERGLTPPPLKLERARGEDQVNRLLLIAYSMADPDWDDQKGRNAGPGTAIRQRDVQGSPWLDLAAADGEFQLRFRCARWLANTGLTYP